ncbi:sugar ABC transporter ATP-binding protein [Sulfodiicoccus acidiphilus]|uniref:Sugar ABC transporter ATP-binding protein n=1 Tax=Sulfodiicoccus acidiphilus TaxID=1670455 RepID=A0A348B3V7_9CREN|nr:ABC transporter ATP-binding protein [Sulfodiicoccus acidiphilus]BBD72859.1 sugar ABC transporter ATP-binding protein [Sulfodiicoccus acidiphilus]GGT88424.1 sugar ABC transporter ATP-binding protein [Sulfodiicoccus acidiphilus]
MSVELRSVTKRYGDYKAVNGVSLHIEKGELFVFLGPSGSGKTTLLRLVAGLEKADEGKIILDGTDVTSLPPSKRNVSMVFQNYALFPHKTVLQNLLLPVEGDRDALSKVRDVAAKLKIDDLLDRYPSSLSGGQQQRVALARALVKLPRLFLMDEPLSNLDAPLRFSARHLIRELQRESGITTIYVTHDQGEAMAIADRIAIMNRGRIVQVGAPEEVYNEPTDQFVASFIGYPPMVIVDSVGVRAEDVVLGQGERNGVVKDVEFMGDRYLVYVSEGEKEIMAFSRTKPKIGDNVRFSITKFFKFEEFRAH